MFGYNIADLISIDKETYNPLLKIRLREAIKDIKDRNDKGATQNKMSVEKLAEFKQSAMGVGLRKVLSWIKAYCKHSRDNEAKLLQLLLELEFANLSAKVPTYSKRERALIYERKEFCNILTIPGATVLVNGVALDDSYVIKTESTNATEYLPAGVLFQLIVDLQAELEQKNVWLNGAIFAQDGCRALVCREGDTLSIYVLGAERTRVIEYLNELRGRIRDVAGDLNHTATIRAQMLGFRIGNQMEYFDYDRLLAAKECKEERVISRILKASVVIQDVLDQTDRSSRWETRKLLKNIALACAQLQAKTLSISDGENDRNTELRDTLENMDYNVKDQTLIGEGKSGKRPNELDLLVLRADGEPWLILEALNVTTKDASTNWDEHLEKLVGRYNVWGLPTLVLLSYVNCSGSKFASLFEKYDAHMKEYRPKAAKLIPNSHESFCPFSEEKSAFRAAQCTYERNGKPVTVYHYFVHMGSKKSDSGK